MTQRQLQNERKGGAAARCPVCGKEAAVEVRPFCSPRCRDVDLNRWLAGVYRVETDEAPGDIDEVPPAGRDE